MLYPVSIHISVGSRCHIGRLVHDNILNTSLKPAAITSYHGHHCSLQRSLSFVVNIIAITSGYEECAVYIGAFQSSAWPDNSCSTDLGCHTNSDTFLFFVS